MAFVNDALEKLLKEEPQEVRDAVDKFREDDIAAKLAALKEMENGDLLHTDELNLPLAEQERLKIGRERHR